MARDDRGAQTGLVLDASGQPWSGGNSIAYRHANPTYGGARNPLSGMGGALDKGDATYFYPTRLYTRRQIYPMYVESWAAKKIVDIPVDDMFIKGRRHKAEDESVMETLYELEGEFATEEHMALAMKAARLFGTGLVLFVTGDRKLEERLELDRIKEGDLKAVHHYDRFHCTVEEVNTDLSDPNCGKPERYKITPTNGDIDAFVVHHTRVLRFDGVPPVSQSWDSTYDEWWGVSVLIQCIQEIIHDVGIAGGLAHLAQEAAIPVLKLQDVGDLMAAKPAPGEKTLEEYAIEVDRFKSLFRTYIIGAEDDFKRDSVSLMGFADALNAQGLRMAASAGISSTRFMSRSPVGMNATGEGDAVNDAKLVLAMQEKMLDRPMRWVDKLYARHAGLPDPPEFEWVPLVDLSDEQKAVVSHKKAEAISLVVQAGVISEDEGREKLDGDDLFGELGEAPPELKQARELQLEADTHIPPDPVPKAPAAGATGPGKGKPAGGGGAKKTPAKPKPKK